MAQIEILNKKKRSLHDKQNSIQKKVKQIMNEREGLEASIEIETVKEQSTIIDFQAMIKNLEVGIEEVEQKLTRVKQFKTENPNTKLIQFLEKSIQSKEKQLECPVCFHIAKAPIFSCSESHLVCGDCRPKLRFCPECRCGYKEMKRHRYAEMLAKELDTLRQERDELGSC